MKEVKSILVFGVQKDPHVERVVKHLGKSSVNVQIIDYLGADKVCVEMNQNGCFRININNSFVEPPFLIWDRLKISDAGHLAIKGEERSADYQTKEWRAFYHMLRGMYPKFVVNSPFSRHCMVKPYQQKVAAEQGLKVPPSCITNNKDKIIEFSERHNNIILKSLSAGKVIPKKNEGKFPYVLMTMDVNSDQLKSASPESISACPHHFQLKIEKNYELRVVAILDTFFAFKVESQKHKLTRTDWRAGIPIVDFSPIELSNDIKFKLTGFMKKLGLFSGSFDLIVDKEGFHWFLECNQDGQWVWLDDLVNEKISIFFAKSLESHLYALLDNHQKIKYSPFMPEINR